MRTPGEILRDAKTIALVGASPRADRPSNSVMRYLLRQGYDVIPVRPAGCDAVLGVPCVRTLPEIDRPIDLVDVFRRSELTPAHAREAVEVGAGALWLQFGVISPEGARIAQEGGLAVVMDRCLKVEHARYVGRMHWLGFNTGIISSVRGGLQ